MKRIPLAEYVEQHGQVKTAIDLGVYQSAISKAIRASRNVTVLIHENGSIEAEELKPFPSQKRDSQVAAA